MYTIKQITLEELFNNTYLFKYYEEESSNKLLPNIKPNKDLYLLLEKNGLKAVGLYSSNILVGFITFNISLLTHYSFTAATTESIFILKEHRVYGNAKKLLEYAETIAKRLGARVFFMTAPIGSRLEKAAPMLGYTPTNILHTKVLS